MIKNESLPLMQIIEALGQTEWRKASSSEYVVKELGEWVVRKQDEYPPVVAFRFKKGDRFIF